MAVLAVTDLLNAAIPGTRAGAFSRPTWITVRKYHHYGETCLRNSRMSSELRVSFDAFPDVRFHDVDRVEPILWSGKASTL